MSLDAPQALRGALAGASHPGRRSGLGCRSVRRRVGPSALVGSMPYSPSVAKSITRSTLSTTRWPRSLRPWNMAGNLRTASDGTYVMQGKLQEPLGNPKKWLDQREVGFASCPYRERIFGP